MCGICGFINLDGRSASGEIIGRMNDTISHRGPDDSGYYVDGSVALGHRRLSIIDLARGHQPLFAAGKPQVIVYNGEIYNHAEIRQDLEAQGARYQTTCDTETILIASQMWGVDCVRRFRGMFAFAIYNPGDGSLFLARDRLGIKPLYLYRTPRLLAFASEIKALLAHPEISAEVNVGKLPVQLALKYTLDDETLFRGIRKLQPGHQLLFDGSETTVRKYWDLSFANKLAFTSEREAAEAFELRFTDAVRTRLMADVPLGVFLSGGIDSSVIAAAMSKMVEEPIKAYSVGFAERGYSEFEYSRAVGTHIGAQVREVVITPEQCLAAWAQMVYHEDEPVAHPSSIALHFVSKLAAQEVKVVLTGEGADELLAGYGRYSQTLYNIRFGKFIPPALRQLLRRGIDVLPDTNTFKRKATRTSLYLDTDIDSIYLDDYASLTRSAVAQVLKEKYRPDGVEQIYAGYSALMEQCDADNLLEQILFADIKTYLLELLMKQDQMSMSASLESRVPFLDHELVEFICRLPVELKLKGFSTKRILRMALGETIPPQIVTRRKMGFPTPIREWFRGTYHPIARKLLLSKESMSSEYFNRDEVEVILRRHRCGEWNLEEQIWSLCNFEIWLRIFLGGQAPESILGTEEDIRACASSG